MGSPNNLTSVTCKERAIWASNNLSVHEWVRDGLVALVCGLVMLIKSPLDADSILLAVSVGIGAGGLMLAAQFFGNMFERAEPEILRPRLREAYERIAQLERQTSDKVQAMLSALILGQNVAAGNVTSETEHIAWRAALGVFNDLLRSAVQPKLEEHEWARLRHADDDGQPVPSAFNEDHRREWRKLKARRDELQRLIDENLKRS